MNKEPQNPDSVSRALATINDRLRVPWISGARQIDVSLIPPLILLPVSLHIAALHYLLGIIMLTAMPIVVLWYYFFTHRKKGRTLFFLGLALFSLFYMFYLFLTQVVPRGEVNELQLAVVTAGVALTVIFLMLTKRGPGLVRPRPSETHSTVTYHSAPPDVDGVYLNGARHQVVIGSRLTSSEHTSEPGAGEGEGVQKRNWCAVCKVVRPQRAGHCRICGVCVLRLDHHCVWWVCFKLTEKDELWIFLCLFYGYISVQFSNIFGSYSAQKSEEQKENEAYDIYYNFLLMFLLKLKCSP